MGMKIKINKSALDKVVKDAAMAKAMEMTYDIEPEEAFAPPAAARLT